ncbi:MAG: hypothetical protein GX895_01440 [Clostridiales bacterium]|uniref:hypothetical protein n=1 Tax=Clostridium sp. N3C TaxID=1776758 RepID=UPI00092E135D|nr:hypothetical protein [Clostridium sp. N3C]NLZ47446.1 hypothetical protein [Clostridiales bacterium]SCN21618.1 hypothetical protein N3C_0330 [Clostridium sp. N3C]
MKIFGNGFGGLWPSPFVINANNNEDQYSKMAHDEYEVYVNDDFIGHKTLVAQGEKVEDIEDYLKTQGFRNFHTKLEGNVYNIHCVEEDSKHMKEVLAIYLRIR